MSGCSNATSADRNATQRSKPSKASKVLVARIDVRCDAESLTALDRALRDLLHSHPGSRADVVSISEAP